MSLGLLYIEDQELADGQQGPESGDQGKKLDRDLGTANGLARAGRRQSGGYVTGCIP